VGLPFQPVKPVRGGRPLDDLFAQLTADPKWVVQAKMDGQRAVWDPDSPTGGNRGTLWSRRELPIHSPSVLAVLNEVDEVLDGEFIPVKGGRGSGTYWVFDLPDHRGYLPERWAALEALVKSLGVPDLVRLCPSGVEWPEVEANGWEGVVFKRLASKYPKAMTPNNTTPKWVKYRAEWL
jgi:ATP-dependent DNA ligase